ncbi:MAG: ABC transporter substrate-binding protein [Thermodesulfobacteriota bacterium]
MAIRRRIILSAHGVGLLVLAVFLSSAIWAAPGPAMDSLKQTLDKVIETLNAQSLKTPDKEEERRVKLSQLIRERFDEEEFSKRALGAEWRKRTKEEKEEFIEVFSELLERTYLDKIDSYLAKSKTFSKNNILYLSETARGSYVVVSTKILTKEDTEIPVLYLLKKKQGSWLVCDVAIEGVSIAKNYRAQFNEIIANSSFKELLAKLKSKEKIKTVEPLKD